MSRVQTRPLRESRELETALWLALLDGKALPRRTAKEVLYAWCVREQRRLVDLARMDADAISAALALPLERAELIARALRDRGIGTLEIKKRGVDIDPATLRTKLKLRGPEAATLFVTRIGDRRVTLLADRV